ncbi:TonB-dependent receptor [beta proteobacterium AAP99]|nr:TonB-dependent receptor [beta proteobacterium AAP99]
MAQTAPPAGVSTQAPVVVTGTLQPTSVQRLAADVVVIDRETIESSTADSVADLLRREAGLQLSRNGDAGQPTALFVRGATSAQTVVLIDGVRIGSATLSQAAFENLDLNSIERIEVLRGPGSSLYGADAVGGVIQIFTRRGTGAPRWNAALAAGRYASRQLSAGVSGTSGPLDYAAQLAHERSEGVSALRPGDRFGNYNPDRDGFERSNIQLQAGFKPAAGQRIGLMLLQGRLENQYDASQFLPPNFAQDNTPDFRSKGRTEVAALDWRGELAPTLRSQVRVARNLDTTDLGAAVIDRFRTTRESLAAQLAWNTGSFGQLTGALERMEEKAQSTSYVRAVHRTNNAATLELTGSAGPAAWQADVRRDAPSDYADATTARLGGSWALADGLRLKLLAGSTFRAPSFNDLYFPGYGVAGLKAERGRSIEAGLAWRNATSEAGLTVYRNRVRDLIGYEPDRNLCPTDPAYDFGCARNISRARIEGATLSAAHTAGAWELRGTVDALEARDERTQQRLPRRAAHQASASALYSLGDWRFGASALRVGERPDGGKRLAAETTVDLQAQWRLMRGVSLQARLLNATDERIEPARDYQGLGRQFWLGVKLEGNL